MLCLLESAYAFSVYRGINDGHEESREWQEEYRSSDSAGHAADEADKNRQAENGHDASPI
jgi:hypothetical protein